MALHPNLAAIEAALAVADSRVLRDFLTYMHEIHPADRLPARAAFDPMRVPHLLSHLVLVQVERETHGMRFLVRVAGEMVLRAAPVPLMNRYIETSVNLTQNPGDESQARIVNVRQKVAETGCAIYFHGHVNVPFRFNFAAMEYVHCPLAEDGVTVDRVLSAFYYHGAPDN
ncbi:PAS domain-containing protein [Ferrovibrio terrae]|uniref:PAS domain-containing protein n=1 Tax=Ferrovibrio terrae TaxID=2594003 RepID=A0A516H5Z8_9PROT|nr:PAS domain-containing protein [Ferrovibrio terrae]QDO99187.1 PAS domain-containing protein [Ferrovibrio terrae]